MKPRWETSPDDEARRIEAVLLERVQSETEERVYERSPIFWATFPPRTLREIRRPYPPDLKVPAIRAIGRNIDPVWTKTLEEQMGSDDPPSGVKLPKRRRIMRYRGCAG